MPSRTGLGPLVPNKLPHQKYADQHRALPFAAKPEWADDTAFLFAEPDTVFTEAQAKDLSKVFAKYNWDMSTTVLRHKLEEMVDRIQTPDEQREYQRLLEQWKEMQRTSSAAAWPLASSSYPSFLLSFRLCFGLK